MYPIEKAKIENEHLQSRLEDMRTALIFMKDFVNTSPKFRDEPYINVADVALMLSEILSADTDREFEPFGASCWANRGKEYRANWLRNFAADA